MEEVSNTDVEERGSPTESGEGPVTHSAPEVLLSTHTYNSPDDVHSIDTNEDRIPNTVSESLSSLLCDKCKPEDLHNTDDKHLDSSGIYGGICRGSRMSADSMESELNSDFSSELLDISEVIARKKKRDLMQTDDAEDPEEEFRRHFLKTFQDLPRLSQISLDDSPKKTPTERNQKAEIDIEMPTSSNEDTELLTKKGDDTGETTIPRNTSNIDSDNTKEPDNNIAENTETNLLENSDIQEIENADEMLSSSNKNM
ncbi:uncharacterized protein LOC26526644 [Drosophila erecta]|uniref:Uncharacterized protein n=1 Tax=Drosophila erecta TaxID=7220 RepID=A0A0Q5WI45_DROER|nr:uncharacterized protein LOC26526644 [Drosophila erecta]KQS69998.1 uncharacterized protein Dere_GG26820 [Drosophila erecta]